MASYDSDFFTWYQYDNRFSYWCPLGLIVFFAILFAL